MSSIKVRLGRDGSILLPGALLCELGLKPGEDVVVQTRDGGLALAPAKTSYARWRQISHDLLARDQKVPTGG